MVFYGPLCTYSTYTTAYTHLWFDVAVHDALGMNKVDGRHEFARDAARLGLGEMFLASNAIQQLAASQQLHYNVHVQLTKPQPRVTSGFNLISLQLSLI